MKQIITIVIAIAVSFSCGVHTPSGSTTGGNHAPASQELTLMTYNVGNFSKYQESSLPQVASLIKEYKASLVSLNELDSCNRRHNSFQLKELADSLGCHNYHFARALSYAGGAYGNGVISSDPIIHSYSIDLPKADGSETRSAAVVETESAVFASVHLDHMGTEARPLQVKTLNNWFREHYAGCSKPVFLCGDMNATPESNTIALLEESWERLSGRASTHSTEHPSKCIDYIFAFKDAAPVQIISAQVLRDGTQKLSDHFPVAIRIRF